MEVIRRKHVSVEFIRDLLSLEAAACAECDRCTLRSIEVGAIDSNGCNWTLFRSNSGLSLACWVAISPLVGRLQTKFNVGTEVDFVI